MQRQRALRQNVQDMYLVRQSQVRRQMLNHYCTFLGTSSNPQHQTLADPLCMYDPFKGGANDPMSCEQQLPVLFSRTKSLLTPGTLPYSRSRLCHCNYQPSHASNSQRSVQL